VPTLHEATSGITELYTMSLLEIIFWSCAAVVAYTYAGYPLILACVARFCKRPPRRVAGHKPSVSVIVAAHNEVANIDRRLAELTGLLTAAGVTGEVIVVSDGSTDGTAVIARARSKEGRIRVVEIREHVGKAAALNAGSAAATHDVLVFADARQTWAPTALAVLLENFADPAVGAVSGDLVVQSAPGVMAGVGMYWGFEKWLRKKESQIHSQVGVTGAISAVRRKLFRPIPDGTLLDDVYWPLCVTMQGFRVVHEKRAVAYDRLPERARDEFRRKVRTLSGNFQLVARLPSLLLPWRNPLWLQFLSHKLLRLLAPWALLGMLATSALLPGSFFAWAFWGQCAAYLVGVTGIWQTVGAQLRPAAAAASFLVLNAAAWLAFWVWISGRAGRSWGKVSYRAPPLAVP
jgi:cellulose synthase/poly-beta-1,6-N-acetylglucosamine synthase-like glycosyltransferase